jgi:DNA polymerase I-like protein with 3'-5' exonuclease and polymerase domains
MDKSLQGRIMVVKDPALRPGSAAFDLLDKIMFDVVQIEPSKVTFCDLKPVMDLTNTDVILSIGEKSLNFLTGLKGITKYTGTLQTTPKGVPVIPIVSPGFLEHNPNYMLKFAEDIQQAYFASVGITRADVANQYKIVDNLDTLNDVLGYIQQTEYCSFDFETTELTDMMTFDPNFYCTSLSLSFQQGSSFVIPLYHPESPFSEEDLKFIFKLLSDEVFGNPAITKVGQNVKFDMHCAAWCGITHFRGPFHDTMLMHQLINENLRHNLKDMVREYYPRFANYEKNLGTKDWASIPLKTLARYNALDSDLTFRLYWVYTSILLTEDEGRIYLMYRNLTAAATKTLFKMEEHGLLIDKAFLTKSLREVEFIIEEQEARLRSHPEVRSFEEYKTGVARETTIVELEKKQAECIAAEYKGKQAKENQIKRTAAYGMEISRLKAGLTDIEHFKVNFNSPAQLKELLFTSQGFDFNLPKKNGYGLPEDSTGADNLDLIKDKTGFVEDLKIYRQLGKIYSTYLSSILEKLDDEHYIHTNFNQHIAKTGRLSSDKPNLQNVITRTDYKVVEEVVALVKKAFITPENHTMVQADYSQIELRVIAVFADEPNMLEAYRTNQDLHEITAANSRGYTIEEYRKLDPKLFKQYRFEAKAENFGFVYGISPEGFKEYARTTYKINISSREAEHRRQLYFQKYPKLLEYHQTYINKARKFGYVRTFFGRKIHLPDIHSINGGVRGHAERNAINSPIQGTAGEMTIWALTLLDNRLDPRIRIVLDIHDAIYFYIPDILLDEALPVIRECMEHLPFELYFYKSFDQVPIKVDFEATKKSWKDMEALK